MPMAVRSPIEVVQIMARQRARAGQSPLLSLHTLEARTGGRISHLPISPELEHAWVALTGEPFRPHQSLAFSSLRRGEPFALVGGDMAARQTLYLLLHEMLRGELHTRVLLLVPNNASAGQYQAELEQLNAAIKIPLSVASISTDKRARQAVSARVLLVPPDALHQRLLRCHDRAWQPFWSNLRLIVLMDVDHYRGVAIGHLAGLLLRSGRLVNPTAPLFLAATLAEAIGADAVLAEISGQPWRIITVDDVPHPATSFAIWYAGAERLRETVALAQAYQREQYRVHICATPLEIPLLSRLLGPEPDYITLGTTPRPAQVQIFAGYPGAHAIVRQALVSHALLTLLILGNSPAERTLARLTGPAGGASPLLNDPPSIWALPAANAYVAAQHLLCAASELPLTATEVLSWQATELVARLERQQQLVCLPGGETVWQPLVGSYDPYTGFGMRAAGIPITYIQNEQSQQIDVFDPSAFDRWGFSDAALPPLSGGYRVASRDEENGVLVLKPESDSRRTFPLRRCTVTVRDERKQRMVYNRILGWGRVLIEEEIYGYREVQANKAPAEWVLSTPSGIHWAAPALWIDVPVNLKTEGQLVGWSLVAALPLRVLCDTLDLVPAYDPELRRIYFIDTQPGGNGLAAWLYEQLETILPLAYDVALDSRNDVLWEPLARVDMDWMLTLLGGEMVLPEALAPAKSTIPVPAIGAETWAAEAEPGTYSPLAAWPEPLDDASDELPAYDELASIQPTSPRVSAVTGRSVPPASEPRSSSVDDHRLQARAAQSGSNMGSKKRVARSKGRNSDPRATVPAPQAPAPALEPPTEVTPDASAMIARMRRMRQQHESRSQPVPGAPAHRASDRMRFPVEPRFKAGDQIFCLPYGYGDVQESRIEENTEVLKVEFPDYGVLTIDSSVSQVRLIAPTNQEDVL